MENLTVEEKQRMEEMSIQMQYGCSPQQARDLREAQETLDRMKAIDKKMGEDLEVMKARTATIMATLDLLDSVAKRKEEEARIKELQKKSWISRFLDLFTI